MLALACALMMVLLASGRWRVTSEALGLVGGGILIVLVWLGVAIP